MQLYRKMNRKTNLKNRICKWHLKMVHKPKMQNDQNYIIPLPISLKFPYECEKTEHYSDKSALQLMITMKTDDHMKWVCKNNYYFFRSENSNLVGIIKKQDLQNYNDHSIIGSKNFTILVQWTRISVLTKKNEGRMIISLSHWYRQLWITYFNR